MICAAVNAFYPEDVLVDLCGRNFEDRRVLNDAVYIFEHACVVVTVDRALVKNELAVNILAVNNVAVAVKLMHMALCAERNEHRKRAEIVDMMINGTYAERAEVGYYHRAVERAYIQKLLRQQTEIVGNAQKPDGKADDEARQGSKLVCKFLGAVFLVGVFDLVDGGVHAAVNVIDRVGGLERYLDGSLARIDGQTAFYGHDDLNILARIDALADAEAVESQGDTRRREHMPQ